MADPFVNNMPGLESPATRHFEITPADSDLSIIPRALFVTAGGDLVIRDAVGTDVTYSVTVGSVLPFRPVQVRSATTATVVGWY